GREDGEGLDSRDRGHPQHQLGKELVRRSRSVVPGLEPAAVEPAGGEGDLEGEVRLRDLFQLRVDGARRLRHLVERGVRRGVEDAEDHALVLGGRQLFRRLGEHQEREPADDDPGRVDRASRREGGFEAPSVGRLEPIEGAVDQAREALFLAASIGLRPSRRCRSTVSTTTMASSTTSPTERTMARRVRRLMVKPSACTRKRPPISEVGMATTGTNEERSEPRKRKMTITTI